MNLSPYDLQHFVILPTLKHLGMYSKAAEKLLLGTAALESGLNPFGEVKPGGIGIYQITTEQHRNIWDNFLAFDPDLASRVRGLASQHHFLKSPDNELRTNLAYSTGIAFMIYLQSNHPLPSADDVDGLDHFWLDNFHHQQQHNGDLAAWIRKHGSAA